MSYENKQHKLDSPPSLPGNRKSLNRASRVGVSERNHSAAIASRASLGVFCCDAVVVMGGWGGGVDGLNDGEGIVRR